ncbi:thioesterase family protein [Micromonospora wenchangensis]|uniref:thioesterase family protein n=1 Tax=Micromonospora wenchangensis TaxID=1185415 RepID=UPI003D75A6AD
MTAPTGSGRVTAPAAGSVPAGAASSVPLDAAGPAPAGAAGGAGAAAWQGRRVEGERTRVVREDDCATRWGNDGLMVLSTPAMLGLMEQTCVEVLAPVLAAGEMTVGVGVTLTHAAVAGCGEPVAYRVALTVVGRDVDVDFTVVGPTGTVLGHGSHRRRVVDRAAFLRRLPPPTG